VIDASCWWGQWPFSIMEQVSLAGTARRLREAGVKHALISPIRAVLAPDAATCNRDLLAEVRNLDASMPEDFRFSLVPVVNPALPGWRVQLNDLLDDAGPLVAGVKIIPNYHQFDLGDGRVSELARMCQARNLPLCIQVRVQDERSHHPLLKVPGVDIQSILSLATTHPGTRMLVCGAYNAELPRLATAPNIHVEISFVESIDTLAVAIASFDAKRLLFATNVPVHDPAPSVAKLVTDPSLASAVQDIASGNARRLFHL